MVRERDRRRGGHLLIATIVGVGLVVAGAIVPTPVMAGIGDREQAGRIETFPPAPDGSPPTLTFPPQFDRSVVHLQSFPVRVVFPHIAVSTRAFPYFADEGGAFRNAPTADVNVFAAEVRQLLADLWQTVDGHRALQAIQSADPEGFAPTQRWPVGHTRGAPLGTTTRSSDVLITIFLAPQSSRLQQRFQSAPLDPTGAKSTGSGSAISFRSDTAHGTWQQDGRLSLVTPQMALGQLLFEASYPLLGADDGGELPAVTNTTVRDRWGGEYSFSETASVRELLAHGGSAERAVAGSELLRNGKNPSTAWTGNDPLMREALFRELQRPQPDPERVRLLWDRARKPLSVAELAIDLTSPHPSIVEAYTREILSQRAGWVLDRPLLIRMSSVGPLTPERLGTARREDLAVFQTRRDRLPAEHISAAERFAFRAQYQQVVDRDRRALEDLRSESRSEEGIDQDLAAGAWQDYIERQMFLEIAYGNGASAEPYRSRLISMARAAEKERVDSLERDLPDC